MWVAEGFDRKSNMLIERIELAGVLEEGEIMSALGSPGGARYAAWPATPELMGLLELNLRRSLNRQDCDYFVEYQVEL